MDEWPLRCSNASRLARPSWWRGCVAPSSRARPGGTSWRDGSRDGSSDDERERELEALVAGRRAAAIAFLAQPPPRGRARGGQGRVSGARAPRASPEDLGVTRASPGAASSRRGSTTCGPDGDSDGEDPPPLLARDARRRSRHARPSCSTCAARPPCPRRWAWAPADLRRRVDAAGSRVVDELHSAARSCSWASARGSRLPLVAARAGANSAGPALPVQRAWPASRRRARRRARPHVARRQRGARKRPPTALGDAWNAVAAEARPPEDDIAAWFELPRREPADEEPRAVLARAEERCATGIAGRASSCLLRRVELTTSG